MPKRCIICEKEEAKYSIKDSNECYCEDCAHDNFADISMLVKIEEQAKRLKQLVDEKIEGNNQDNDEE